MIEQTHELPASPDTVFAHLTQVTKLDTWWTTSSESDPREGGAFVFRFDMTEEAKAGGKPDHAERGTFTRFVPGKELVFPWDSHAPTEVAIKLERTDGGCALHLRHNNVPEPMAEQIAEGWQFFLGNLKTVLSDGQDQRGAFGLKV